MRGGEYKVSHQVSINLAGGLVHGLGLGFSSWAASRELTKNKVDSFSRVFSIRVSRGETWPTLVAERSWAT